MTTRRPSSRPRPRPKPANRGVKRRLDAWFGTVVRYAGLVAMGDAVFFDHLQHIALVTAATGMILFKSVLGDD